MPVSFSGNILINVGPTHDGRIPVLMEERLRQLGTWLSINGQAIYETSPWIFQNDTETSGVWFVFLQYLEVHHVFKVKRLSDRTIYDPILN